MQPGTPFYVAEPRQKWSPEQVQIFDFPEPARTRRTSDLIRLLLTLVVIALIIVAGSVQSETTSGLQQDITSAVRTVPDVIVSVLATLNSLVVLALPIYLVAELALRRRWRLMLTSLLAGALAQLATQVFNFYSDDFLGKALLEALTRPVGDVGHVTLATFGLFAAVVSLVTAQGSAVRPRTSIVVWGTLLPLSVLFLIDRRATPFALLLSVVGGHAIGLAVRYISGTDNPRVSALQVAEALAGVGARPSTLIQLEGENELGRRFSATIDDGSDQETTALVQVMDPDRGTIRMLAQLTRLVRVRTWVTRAPSFSKRVQVQQLSVPILMAREVGVRAPRLIAAAEVNESTMLVAEEQPGDLRLLSGFTPEAVSDEAIAQCWHQVLLLHQAGVSHEGLNPDSFAVDNDGRIWILGLNQGEIAASGLRMRLDRAELLLATAILVGVDRAITAAEAAIGDEDLANLPALLQPVALNQANRAELKTRKDLLVTLREEASARAPEPTHTPVRLERLRPRTVVSIVALTFAVYVLAGQLGNVDFNAVFRDVDWVWAALAVIASLFTYIGAALTIAPFSPVKIPASRWLSTQFASEFVRLVAPAAVGSAGTNVRVIQKAGAPTSLALASVGVSTLVSFVTTILAFVAITVFSQADTGFEFEAPSNTVWVIVGVLVGMVAMAFIVPWTRRMIIERLKPMWESIGPRLLDVLRNPRRLTEGVLGSLLTSLSYAVTLYAAVRAYGEDLPIAAAAAVYLGAGILGTVAPTPGGIGAVEAALVAGLSAVGIPAGPALLAALLYRLVTFWLPTVPGWLAFQWLQRNDAI
ncbi:MAG: lysylphosphatidylglycerol synthase transmembrane domain-containing protein [Microthrixaceae bacterium]